MAGPVVCFLVNIIGEGLLVYLLLMEVCFYFCSCSFGVMVVVAAHSRMRLLSCARLLPRSIGLTVKVAHFPFNSK